LAQLREFVADDEKMAQESVGESTVVSESADTAPPRKRIISNRYEILGDLGRGGMGSVHKARHTTLGKIVAVKVLNANLSADATFWKRFEIEAQAGSKMTHPNLINVFDYGLTDEQQPYLAMDYVEGFGIDNQIKAAGRLSVEEFFSIFKQ